MLRRSIVAALVLLGSLAVATSRADAQGATGARIFPRFSRHVKFYAAPRS